MAGRIVRWSRLSRQLIGRFKVHSATLLDCRQAAAGAAALLETAASGLAPALGLLPKGKVRGAMALT